MRLPNYPVPEGETPQSMLEKLPLDGATRRYPGGIPERMGIQLAQEFELTGRLGYGCYQGSHAQNPQSSAVFLGTAAVLGLQRIVFPAFSLSSGN